MMSNIAVLDCTLRDGGYINNWNFGAKNIKRIVQGLCQARTDIVECGYLAADAGLEEGKSLLADIDCFEKYLDGCDADREYVCMINYGDFDIAKLPDRKGRMISGIRLAFHKKNLKEALDQCENLKQKGYDVYVQPMVTMEYTDMELLDLIGKVNRIAPRALYMVDSFGAMRKKDMLRMYYLVNHNLNGDIMIGLHTHNNLQLAYSNAQALVEIAGNREIIIDTSIFGMGRGAGNLNTELFMEYLNDLHEGKYDVAPLLKVMDSVLTKIFITNRWGYSLPYYLTAVYNCHPNYASFLASKNTLTVEEINVLLSQIQGEKKNSFDKKYVTQLYEGYMNSGAEQEKSIDNILNFLRGQTVVLVAPGKTISTHRERILAFIKEQQSITIAINMNYSAYPADYIFVSNIRRFRELEAEYYEKTIVTSNIRSDEVLARLGYDKLENSLEGVRDNAGLMAIRFLIDAGVKKIFLAGFDGYSAGINDNYAAEDSYLNTDSELLNKMNEGMRVMICEYKKEIAIQFITPSKLDVG